MKYIRKMSAILLFILITPSIKAASLDTSQKLSIAAVATLLIGWKLYCVYNNAYIDQLEIDNKRIAIWDELTQQKKISEHNARELMRHLDTHAPTIQKMNYLYGHYAVAFKDLPDHGYAMSTVKVITEDEQRQERERSWWRYMQSFYKK